MTELKQYKIHLKLNTDLISKFQHRGEAYSKSTDRNDHTLTAMVDHHYSEA